MHDTFHLLLRWSTLVDEEVGMTTPHDATARSHRRFATTRLPTGLQVQYAEQGDPTGDAIIFLHGYAASWYSFSRGLPVLAPTYAAAHSTSAGGASRISPPAATPWTTLPPLSLR